MESLANVLEQKFPLFNTVTPEHSLKDALYQMCCERLDYLVVLKGAEFAGIVSEQDVAHKLFATNREIDDLEVKDIMNTRLPVASSQDNIDYAMQIMNRHHSRYIAVFEDLTFKGIVSENDLLKKTIENKAVLSEEQVYQDSFHWSY